MTRADKVLVLLLRLVGVGALFALVAVFMPVSGMAATHRCLGLAEMPDDLVRSVACSPSSLGVA
jgi:hypothetical protein